ncbi:hypothetical protein QBC38DRAFT_464472 [Podospora fimiseda]|uniref:RNase MRP protein 1 RNA binding domain-containing protein n=1 Tax=Podospora fimiseda TaxID=252190 RepID=A0AAN7BZM8_9PEZI|nr:hypothetical protein QBC38DRAFT_464472 [Podospora fimiseda]
MADPQPPIHPTFNPSILSSSLDSLDPALEILSKFHHRNKNQHRLSKWWAQSDMLRRHTRKMIDLLTSALLNKKKLKLPTTQNETITQRAQYLRWHLGPGAFLAFTQLTADRQFAQLGLLLLGVLAQINKALEPFSPSPPSDLLIEGGEEDFSPEEAIPEVIQDETPAENTENIDLGVAVSRDSLDLNPSIEQEEDETNQISKPSKNSKILASKDEFTTSKKNPKKKAAADEFDNIFASISSSSSKPKKKKTTTKLSAPPKDEFTSIFGTDNPNKHKKKRQEQQPEEEEEDNEPLNFFTIDKKQGDKKSEHTNKPSTTLLKKQKKIKIDEFDDIFASLDSSQQPKNKKVKAIAVDNVSYTDNTIKKKKKVGDEFDNIFGGL